MRAPLHLTLSHITRWISEVERVTVAEPNQSQNKGDAHTDRAEAVLMSVKGIGQGDVLSCMLQSPAGNCAAMTDWFQSNNDHTLAPRGKAGFAAIQPGSISSSTTAFAPGWDETNDLFDSRPVRL
jgi:hypothetical protein